MIRRLAALALAGGLAGCGGGAPGGAACMADPRGEARLAFDAEVPIIGVTLDGGAASLLLDTGAAFTLLTAEAAARLNLLADDSQRVTSRSIGGSAEAMGAQVARFAFAGMAPMPRQVLVFPFALRGFKGTAPDGVLGADVLSRYDVELDLLAGHARFFQPRDCGAAGPEWLAGADRLPLLPAGPGGRPQIAVTLNGTRLVATLDTGAGSTLLSHAAAARLGIGPAQLATGAEMTLYGVAATDGQSRILRLRELRVGREVIATPEIGITDLPPGLGDMVIGMNFLHGRKLWLSTATGVVGVGAR